MDDDTPGNYRRRILFMGGVLGFMTGVGAVLIFLAVQQENYALIAIAMGLFLTGLPMALNLIRLFKARRKSA